VVKRSGSAGGQERTGRSERAPYSTAMERGMGDKKRGVERDARKRSSRVVVKFVSAWQCDGRARLEEGEGESVRLGCGGIQVGGLPSSPGCARR
jgi:hypothetical protein